MQNERAGSLLETLLKDAKSAGAEAADAVLYHSVSTGVSVRVGNLEDVERSESAELGLRVIVNNQQASVSTTDLSRESLKALAERCAAMAKTAPADPYCGLAPKERLASAPFPDIDPGDFSEPSTQTLHDRAKACEDAALSVDGVFNSGGAGASFSEGRKWLATTDGFFGESGGSGHSLSVSVLARDDNGMERDYDYDSKSHLEDLMAADEIGLSAGHRAVKRLSPKKLKSQSAPVIFDNRLSRSLLSSFAGAINGGAIARGVSYLKDKMGAEIFGSTINIVDDPHLRRGAGSRPFDGEGVANEPLTLIKDGVLQCWIMNSAQAKQLGLETNGRATRGTGGTPGSGTTNLHLQPGDVTRDQLISQANNGLLLTEMFGPQVNPNTGDFSVGCAGEWIENGSVAYPVSEITIAGNLLEMFATLIPANDLDFRGSTNAPSLLIPTMTIAGD